LLFFTKGRETKRIWYYDLADRHVTKKKPLTLADFEDFARRLALAPAEPERISERSWWIDVEGRREQLRVAAEPFKQTAMGARAAVESFKAQQQPIKLELREARQTYAATTELETQLTDGDAAIVQATKRA
jgi:hypothetical protein